MWDFLFGHTVTKTVITRTRVRTIIKQKQDEPRKSNKETSNDRLV